MLSSTSKAFNILINKNVNIVATKEQHCDAEATTTYDQTKASAGHPIPTDGISN